jgi:hypothetical protein
LTEERRIKIKAGGSSQSRTPTGPSGEHSKRYLHAGSATTSIRVIAASVKKLLFF